MPRRRPDKEKVSKARGKSEPKVKAAPKPYLRVPEEFVSSNEDAANAGGQEDLPKAENLFKKHLFNQSKINSW